MIDNNADLKITAWAKEILEFKNYQFLNSKIIVSTPWSTVIAIYTKDEIFYLKQMPKLIALEARIIKILRERFYASIPIIIDCNDQLNCFLMKNSGTSLRTILKNKFDSELLCKAIEQFTLLQRSVEDHVDIFLNIGVPDWRLNKLTNLYKEVISQKDLLLADGLSEIEISALENLTPKVADLAQQLASYTIKETIVQPDFSDNNTLIDPQSKNITIIDLGEISISHPFFSLLNCLQQIQKHYGFNKKDPVYIEVQQAYLKNYMNFDHSQNIMDAFDIASKLWPVYGVLAIYRLVKVCDKEKLALFQHGKLSKTLREFKDLICKKL